MVYFFWAPSAETASWNFKGQNGVLPDSQVDKGLHCGAVQSHLVLQNFYHDFN